MMAAGEIASSSAQRPLRLRMRADLEVVRQGYLGRDFWVVKDPLTLRFFRFEEEEFAILEMLDGKASPQAIQERFEQEFPPQRLSLSQLQTLTSQLFQQSLIVSDAAGQGQQLWQRGVRLRGRTRLAAVTNVLSMRLPGVDPDRFLAWLNSRVGWFFSMPAVVVSLMFIGTALLLVGVHFEDFVRRLPGFDQFFAASNLGLMAIVLGATKVLHELGHGLACKRFGSQCREMGLMLLVLTPCLYCDVSDSWMLPSKWRRAAIGAAGIYVEWVLAALCVFLWWFSTPGLLHYLCLNVIFVCSVSTLLFNANPLLRYDGYYILADLAEIPNLRQKATSVVQRTLGHWLLGLVPKPDPFLPQRRRWLFAFYAVAAVMYRWLILLSILWFLNKVLEPYGLKRVGQILIVLAMYGLLIDPAWRLFRFLRVPGRMREVKKGRLLLSSGLLGGAVGIALLTPLPFSVSCDVTVQLRESASVYVDVPGTVVQCHVRDGEYVQAGQSILTLENIELRLLASRLEGERRTQIARLEALQLRVYNNENALLETANVKNRLAAVERQIERRAEDLRRLVIRAPRDGFVFAASRAESPQSSDRLPGWSGHPLQQENVGAYLAESVLICRVGKPQRWEVVLAIDQHMIPFVQIGQRVDIQLDSLRSRPLSGQIERIANTEMQVTAARFASNHRPSGSSRVSNAPSTLYPARVAVETEQVGVLDGSHGVARIHAGSRCLGKRIWDACRNTFHFEL